MFSLCLLRSLNVERPTLKKTYSQWQNTGCIDLSCVRYTPENPIVLLTEWWYNILIENKYRNQAC